MENMTVEQALNILDKILSTCELQRHIHVMASQALLTVNRFVVDHSPKDPSETKESHPRAPEAST